MKQIQGYLREDGTKGIRNVILVVYLVECAHHVARKIVDNFDDPNIQLIGFSGCAPNNYASEIMKNICTHSNVGGVVLVSLGCENMDRNGLHDEIIKSGRPAELLVIQENKGTSNSILQGIEFVKAIQPEVEKVKKVEMHSDEIILGTICGGSDSFSGITANPSIGKAFDYFLKQGSICIFEEPGELIGCENLLAERAINNEVAKQIERIIKKADNYYKQMGKDSFSEGNATGGITTIEEKSLGSYFKSGSSKINGVIQPGEMPCHKGLYLMDVVPDGDVKWGFPNINDNAEIIELISSGCHLILFSTGRGSVVGSAISPVIKICSNEITYNKMEEDMDLNAGKILNQESSTDDLCEEIKELVYNVCCGERTKSEALRHQEFVLSYKYFNKSDCKY
jgi:altronate dehydratase large subunit